MGLSFNMPDIVWKISFAYNSQKRHMRLQDAILVKVNGSMHCNGLWGIFFLLQISTWAIAETITELVKMSEWKFSSIIFFILTVVLLLIDIGIVKEKLVRDSIRPLWPWTIEVILIEWHDTSENLKELPCCLPACLVYIPLNLKHKRASDEARNLDFSEMSRRPGTGGRPKSAGPGPGQQTTSVSSLYS